MNSKTAAKTRQIVRQLKNALADREEVAVAYLFGSVARQEASPGSDVDVAILLAKPVSSPLHFRACLAEDLGRATRRRVDVVLLSEASPVLAARVIWDGLTILSRDESARVRFECHALSRYFDTAPLRRVHEKALLDDIAEGRFLG